MASLTIGTIPVATSSTNCQDSAITDDGSTVTINENLTVTGLIAATTGSVTCESLSVNGNASIDPSGNVTATNFSVVSGACIAISFSGDGSALTALQGNVSQFTNNAGYITTFNANDGTPSNITGTVVGNGSLIGANTNGALSYTGASAADWAGTVLPTDIKAALDRIAAAFSANSLILP